MKNKKPIFIIGDVSVEFQDEPMFMDEFQEVAECFIHGDSAVPDKNELGEYVDREDFEHLYTEEEEIDEQRPMKRKKTN